MKASRAWRNVGLAAAAFVIGVAGVLAGSALRSRMSPAARTDAYVPPEPASLSLLKPGVAFPDAAVAGTDQFTRTADAIGPDGAVFLFLDLECPPCGDMARKWEDARVGAAPEGLPIVAVTNQPPEAIAEFVTDHGLTFPVVEDTEHVFLTDWRVQRFPLEVIVGADGRIRSVSYDSVGPVDAGRLSELLAG